MHFAVGRKKERERKGREIRKEHLGIQNESTGGWFFESYSWAGSKHVKAGQSSQTTQTCGTSASHGS